MQSFQSVQVGADVFTDGGVGAAAGFYCFDAWGGEGSVAVEELGVFTGEDVVCYCGDGVGGAEVEEEGEEEGGFAGAYWAIRYLVSGPLLYLTI